MSHLRHFGVGNFKVFKDLTHFDLAPITILTGKNNSGKSSLIKSMLLLKSNPTEKLNIFRGYNFEQWRIDDSDLKLGSPEQVFNYENLNKNITFDLSLNNPMIPNGKISLEYSFNSNDEIFNLIAFRISNNDESIIEINSNLPLDDSNDVKLTQYFKIDFKYFIDRIRELAIVSPKGDWGNLGEKIGLYRFMGSTKNSGTLDQLLTLLDSDLIITGLSKPVFENENEGAGFVKINISKKDLHSIQNHLFEICKNGFVIDKGLNKYLSFINRFDLDLYTSDKILEIFNQNDFLVNKYKNDCSHTILDDDQNESFYFKPELHPFFDYINIFYHKLFDEFQKEFTNITYLPSIRARNERLYMVSQEGYAIQKIDQKEFDNIEFKNETIHRFYLEALKDFEIGESIEIKTYQRTATEITIIRNGRRMLLSDLGFGYAQVIPIILQILITATKWVFWRYKEKSEQEYETINCPKILIEEPESNLHPDFQSKLADLFIKASNLFGIQFIIETHSEYLIRRLQYLTARKDIKPEDISIYYFNNPRNIPQGEKQINKIEIRPDGILKQDFGSGFYDQAANSTFDLFRLISDN